MRVFSLTRFLLCVLALPLAACSQPQELPSEPPAGLDVAWFHDDCAPWDGPATTLYLGRETAEAVFAPPFPYLSISLYSNYTRFSHGGRLRFDVPGNQGYAQYCREKDDCLAATAVRMDFLSVDENRLEGRLEVLFNGRPPILGSFRAGRMPFQALCG